jgi:GAF domain-containing protein
LSSLRVDAQEMDAPPDVHALLRGTCRELVELVEAEGCVLSRVIGELLIEIAQYSPSGQTLDLGHGYLIPDYPLTQAVIEQRLPQTVSLDDPAADKNEAALLRELGFGSLLMLPIVSGDECWGLVELYGRDAHRFGDGHVRRSAALLERAATLISAA